MDAFSPDDLATVPARVVAWHNRHPLARRIRPEQVQSVGYVLLPYTRRGDAPMAAAAAPVAAVDLGARSSAPAAPAAAAATLRERAAARAQEAGAVAATGTSATAAAGVSAAALADGPAALQDEGAWSPAFSEAFAVPLSVRRVARWAARHGGVDRLVPAGVPQRAVAVDPRRVSAGQPLHQRVVLTAAVEVGGQRLRVLLAPGPRGAVLGPRAWSQARLGLAAGGVAGLLGSVVLLAFGGVLLGGTPEAEPIPSTVLAVAPAGQADEPALSGALPTAGDALPLAGSASQAPAPEVVAAVVVDAPVGAADPPDPKVGAIAPAPLPALAPALPAPGPGAPPAAAPGPEAVPAPPANAPDRPVDVNPTLGRVVLPELGLPRPRAAASAPPSDAPAAAPAATAAPTAVMPAARAEGPAAPRATPDVGPDERLRGLAAAVAAGPPGSAFAVSTRLLRTRTESEQTQAAMRSLLRTAGLDRLQVDLVPVGDDWQVVVYPFTRRVEAESARNVLASRGLRVSVVDF